MHDASNEDDTTRQDRGRHDRASQTPEGWQQVRACFQACLDVPRQDRIGFLDSACRDDPDLRDEVEALLGFHDDPLTLLPDRLRDAHQPPVDGQIDRYALIEIVGQGGMGVVYRARRADGIYDEEVALKLLHADLLGESLVQRFQQERQILADLKHPAIARLIDGGTASDGRPFLVMEFVDGVPIDRYCETHGLDVHQRLRLFVEVCRAVHVAHQNLVVHRDLKPANLLVDADGAPKLLDFGVAKLVDPAAPEHTRFGAAGDGTPMTPVFASPEQVSGRTITTASDVYALGAVLYVLLTGTRPFGDTEMAIGALIEAIRTRDPVPPARRVAEALDGASDTERADLTRLARGLDDDLDRVVAMAMHKDPAARYGSAESLAQDLEDYLDGLPVQAREPTLTYRVGKFLRRNRWPSLIAAVVAIVLAALTGGLVLQRNQLLDEQSVSTEVTRFLEGLFRVSDPDTSRGRPVEARELLDQAVFDVRGRFANQPRLRHRLVSTMGRAYLGLGHLTEAETLLEEALESRQALGDEATVDAYLDIGELRSAQGLFDAADAAYDRAAGIFEATDDGHEAQRLRGLLGRAHVRWRQGAYDDALMLQEEGLALARAQFGTRDLRYADALLGMGAIQRLRGALPLAREALEEARAILRGQYGSLHPEVARLGLQIGLVLEEEGRLEDAEAVLRENRSARATLYPEGHPEQAETVNNLASVVLALGRTEEAETLCREGLDLRRKVLDANHPLIGDSLNLLGLIQLRQGRLEVAEASFLEARALWRTSLGPDHAQIAATANNLGQIYLQRELWSKAEAAYRESLRIYRLTYGDDHLQVATVLNNLGFMEKKRGELSSARPHYDEALGIMRRLFGDDHPRTAIMANNLGMLYVQMGEPGAAEPMLRKALDGFAATLPAQHLNLAIIRKNLASSLHDLGRSAEAEVLLREALAILDATDRPDDDPVLTQTRDLLDEVLSP